MKFISTRGEAMPLGFGEAVLAGLAEDGGLYLPENWPALSHDDIRAFAGQPFATIAFEIIRRYAAKDIAADTLREMVDAAYGTFRHPSTTPLVELEPNHFVLELFHGPTLAFKDVAMQFLARAMDHFLSARNQRATIVGATSGDTGSAAIEAFRGRDNIDIFILHPHNRTSAVQRRQMTTVMDENVHNIAVEGTFDDCQHMVKAMFANTNFRSSAKLSGVNSINWGRIVAQIVYYFKAASDLGSPDRKISFCVPTGNFGDIFAGYAAKRMGLPIERLTIATNENDILARTLKTGRYETGTVTPTTSPSMDIQISSNFERLLFEALERDGAATARLLASLNQSGGFDVPENALHHIRRDFDAARADEADVRATMADCLARSGYLADPHTAVGIFAARERKTKDAAVVTLATAHPAKFPDAVKASTQIDAPLPVWLSDLHERAEKYDVLPNEQDVVENYIQTRSRAWGN